MPNYFQIDQVVFDKFLKFSFNKNWPLFSTDQINLSNLGRGSPKDHLCQTIAKLDHHVLTRFYYIFPMPTECVCAEQRLISAWASSQTES